MSWLPWLFSWFSCLFNGEMAKSLLADASQWGAERATTTLAAFNVCQELYPEMCKKELYCFSLRNIGIPVTISHDIVDDASDISKGEMGFGLKLPSLPTSFGLHSVVKHLLVYEEFEHFGYKGYPHPKGLSTAMKAVDDIIPEHL